MKMNAFIHRKQAHGAKGERKPGPQGPPPFRGRFSLRRLRRSHQTWGRRDRSSGLNVEDVFTEESSLHSLNLQKSWTFLDFSIYLQMRWKHHLLESSDGKWRCHSTGFCWEEMSLPVIAVKVRAYSTSAEETLCLSSFGTFFFLPMQMWFTLWITLHFWSPNTSFFPLVYIYMSFLNNYYYCILMLTLFTCWALFQAHYTIIIHINYYIIDYYVNYIIYNNYMFSNWLNQPQKSVT